MAARLPVQLFVFVCVSSVVFCKNHPRTFNHGIKLPTTRPLNIAHRGSSGTHPEHTVAAYEQAVRDGADVIECDLYVTKDLQLVCLHEPALSRTTDVKSHREFARRKRTYKLSKNQEQYDWFCFDFTLAELKKLRAVQVESFRDKKYDGQFNISTFDEYVAVAKNADRPVGIYPELKTPNFINSLQVMNGARVEDLLLNALTKYGYYKSDDPCFIQSFEEESLKYIKGKSLLPLVILVWKNEHLIGPNGNGSKLEEWGSMFYGIGAMKTQVALHRTYQDGFKNWISGNTDFVDKAKAAGLKVHLYTFKNEDRFLAWDFAQNPLEEYEYFMKFDIDGYFTDFPKTMDMYLSGAYHEEPTCSGAASVVITYPNHIGLVFLSILIFRQF